MSNYKSKTIVTGKQTWGRNHELDDTHPLNHCLGYVGSSWNGAGISIFTLVCTGHHHLQGSSWRHMLQCDGSQNCIFNYKGKTIVTGTWTNDNMTWLIDLSPLILQNSIFSYKGKRLYGRKTSRNQTWQVSSQFSFFRVYGWALEWHLPYCTSNTT